MSRGRLLRRADDLYHSIVPRLAKRYVVNTENAFFEFFETQLGSERGELDLASDCPVELLVGTSTGVWHVLGGRAVHLVRGSCNGLTKLGDAWIASQRTGMYARLVRFTLGGGGVELVKLGLSHGVHQIDGAEGLLYVTDSFSNRLLVFNGRERVAHAFPNGRAWRGQASRNYCHFNSVYVGGDRVYLLAHNAAGAHSARSQVFVLTIGELRRSRVVELPTSGAHNVAVIGGKFLYCDSTTGSLVEDGRRLLRRRGWMTRGLAVTKEHIVVGGSAFEERAARFATDGMLWITARDGRPVAELGLPGVGQVLEVRAAEGDLAMSQNYDGSRPHSFVGGAAGRHNPRDLRRPGTHGGIHLHRFHSSAKLEEKAGNDGS